MHDDEYEYHGAFPHHTAYVHAAPERVQRALTEQLALLGYSPVQAARAEELSATVFGGTQGWTIVKFGQPTAWRLKDVSGDPLLSGLCAQLETQACLVSAPDESQIMLFEFAPGGTRMGSGFSEHLSDEEAALYGIEPGEGLIPEFSLLPVEVDFMDLDDLRDFPDAVAALLAGELAPYCDDQQLEEALSGADCALPEFWHSGFVRQ